MSLIDLFVGLERNLCVETETGHEPLLFSYDDEINRHPRPINSHSLTQHVER